MKISKTLVLIAILSISAATTALAAGRKLPANYIKKTGAVTCGYVSGKWIAGTLKRGLFESDKPQLSKLKKQLKRAKGAARKKLEKRIKALNGRDSKCAKLPPPSDNGPDPETPIKNLLQLPALSSIAGTEQSNPAEGVTGEPPLIADIPGMSIADLFWSPGVIDAIASGETPSPAQCLEFFSGPLDGQSAGLSACYATQAAGYPLQPVLGAWTSVCELKNLLTKQMQNAKVLRVTSGSVPDDITKIFNPPEISNRTIKVILRGNPEYEADSTIFLRVYSRAANRQNGVRYAFDLWRCPAEAETPERFIAASIDESGRLEARAGGTDFIGVFEAQLSAALKTDSSENFIFDLSQPRELKLWQQPDGEPFGAKTEQQFLPQGIISTRLFEHIADQQRRSVSRASFAGSSLAQMLIFESAFKEEILDGANLVNSSTSAAQYRNQQYVSAPSSQLLTELAGLNFGTESFFNTEPALQSRIGDYSCAQKTETALSIDITVQDALDIILDCQAEVIDGLDFCEADENVISARLGWLGSCQDLLM